MRDNEARYRRKYGSRAHREYGITREEYDAYMAKPCGICGEPSKHLDHNHTTGEIRGGLCHRCNLGLGYYEGWFLEHRHAALKWIGAE
ncbi:endonuclease VII [Mycobacterium phage Bricole]|nr:endonuclease VII [Mycobacterium phage Bricole]WNM75289.1 endonuclease VII [Mycobacterium phage Auspice]